MPLPLSVAKPRTLAVAPPVVAAGALAVGAGLLWLREQLARRHFQESVFMNDYQQDALYRRPNYRGMTSGQIQQSRQLLDAVGEDAYMLQPGSVYLERRELDRELLRRAGGGGFIFIGPGIGAESDLTGWTAGAAAAATGVAGTLWDLGVAAGRTAGWLRAQLWGLLNVPPWQQVKPDYITTDPYELTFASGTCAVSFRVNGGANLWINGTQYWYAGGERSGPSFSRANCTGFRMAAGAVNLGGTFAGPGTFSFPAIFCEFRIGGVWVQELVASQQNLILTAGQTGVTTGLLSAWVLTLTVNGQPGPPLYVGGPRPTSPPDNAPAISAAVAPISPAALPAYTPPAADPQAVPSADPVTQPAPSTTPAAIPALAPITAPSLPRVPAIPIGTPLADDGTVPAPSPSPTPTTPGQQVLPWPGAKPIDPVPLAPPATLDGIAKKTGELEGKLDQIGGMLQPRNQDFDWEDLFEQAQRLWEWLNSIDPEGGYEISSPCVPEGEPGSANQPLTAAWGFTTGPQEQILKRLDALAELLQHHKNLKQPSCKNPSPVGEVVTVQFEET